MQLPSRSGQGDRGLLDRGHHPPRGRSPEGSPEVTDAQIAGWSAAIGVLGTLAGVFIGGALNELWASKREARQESRDAARLRVDRIRADWLEMIDDTRRASVGLLGQLSSLVAGDANGAALNSGLDKYPRLNLKLIDDENTLRSWIQLAADLASRGFGAGFTKADLDRVARVTTNVQAVLERQRQRALADEAVLLIDDDKVAAMPEYIGAYAAMGVPRPSPAGTNRNSDAP